MAENREDLIYRASKYGSPKQGQEQAGGSDEQAAAMQELSKAMPDLVKAMKEMSVDLSGNVQQFKDMTEGLNNVTDNLGRVEESTKKTANEVEASVTRMSNSFKRVGKDIDTHFLGPLTGGAHDILRALGPVGRGIEGIAKQFARIPGIGFVTTIIGGLGMMTLAGIKETKEMEARLYRVGGALQGFSGQTWDMLKGQRTMVDHLADNWRMGFSGAEKFLTAMAETGKLDIWNNATKVKAFSDEILNMSAASGVAETDTLGFFKKLLHSTSMAAGVQDELAQSMKEVYAAGRQSNMGVKAYTDELMKGTAHMRLYGAEQRTVVESSRMLGAMISTLEETTPGGKAGAVSSFQSVMGLTGEIMQNPAEMLFAFGKGGANPFSDLVGIMTGLSKEDKDKVGKGIPPLDIFKSWFEKMADGFGGVGEGTQGREAMGLMLMKRMEMGAVQANELIGNFSEILDESGKVLSKEEMATLTAEYKKATKQMMDPMQRLSVMVELLMSKLLPSLASASISVLQAILIAIPTGFLELLNWFAQSRFGSGTTKYADALVPMRENQTAAMKDAKEAGGVAGDAVVDAAKKIAEIFGEEGGGIDAAGNQSIVKTLKVGSKRVYDAYAMTADVMGLSGGGPLLAEAGGLVGSTAGRFAKTGWQGAVHGNWGGANEFGQDWARGVNIMERGIRQTAKKVIDPHGNIELTFNLTSADIKRALGIADGGGN